MANTHTVLNLSSVAAENIDAYNKTGVYASGDLDNGTLCLLGAMSYDSTSKIATGYQYAVTLAGANAATGSDLWIVATPEVGYTLEGQIYADPRYFYNEAGKPMSIKRIMPDDTIEVSGAAFGSSSDFPEASEVGYYIACAANGKLGTPVQNDPAYASFKVEALTKIAVGNELVDGCLLRRIK